MPGGGGALAGVQQHQSVLNSFPNLWDVCGLCVRGAPWPQSPCRWELFFPCPFLKATPAPGCLRGKSAEISAQAWVSPGVPCDAALLV